VKKKSKDGQRKRRKTHLVVSLRSACEGHPAGGKKNGTGGKARAPLMAKRRSRISVGDRGGFGENDLTTKTGSWDQKPNS